VLSIENTLRTDILARQSGGSDRADFGHQMSIKSSSGTTLSLPPMPRLQRKFVHEYCQKHYGLRTVGVDPEPSRFVQIQYKNSHPMIPFDMPLSRAISLYPDLGKSPLSPLSPLLPLLLVHVLWLTLLIYIP